MVTAMDRGEICDKFLDSLDFDLYPFQEEALLAWFESDGGLLVSAPTGMGKTLIAESAIFEALHARRRLYYTTPLIALTDQKFREFQDRAEAWGFPRDEIGLVTGNRRINPAALVRVVVAEILLNHLLAEEELIADVSAVVMDEFHYFNNPERGVVWELTLAMLPKHVRLLLLSATVGNAPMFVHWLREKHGRALQLVQTQERRVPLEFIWVGDKLLTEHLPSMVSEHDGQSRAPALVFCFNREDCWQVAEKLKGVNLIGAETRSRIEDRLAEGGGLTEGVGPKLKQILIRGIGVHHAGVLPKYKQIIEDLFLEKLIPFVICTETLAAGVNLPARSVVLEKLLKGKPNDKKLVPPSDAHQMFGRAGRPQFDNKGYVYALAHEDDAKIAKWRKKYEQIDPNSKDPGIMRARKELERKKPTRRKTQQYWTQGQFETLIKSGPANLVSRSMIPYRFLIYLLTEKGTLRAVREFVSKRFNKPERIEKFQQQLDHMVNNLATLGYLDRAEDDDHVALHDSIFELLRFRSADPLYGAFLVDQLKRGNETEKILALESILNVSPTISRRIDIPDHLEPGPLQTQVVEPTLLQLGIALPHPDGGIMRPQDTGGPDYWVDDEPHQPRMTLPDMLKALFESKLASPEDVHTQAKWIAGALFEMEGDFYKFVKARDLTKNEGLVLRHLLRLVILAGEFLEQSGGDPDYAKIGEAVTNVCQQVDSRYTDHFLAAEAEARKLSEMEGH